MKWIPLSERKPDIPYTSNILFAKEGYIIGSYSVLQPNEATHWMYLDPPKPEKPKDPDWEIMRRLFMTRGNNDDRIHAIYEFLKEKYDK